MARNQIVVTVAVVTVRRLLGCTVAPPELNNVVKIIIVIAILILTKMLLLMKIPINK